MTTFPSPPAPETLMREDQSTQAERDVLTERLEEMAVPQRHDGSMVQALRRVAAELAAARRERAISPETHDHA